MLGLLIFLVLMASGIWLARLARHNAFVATNGTFHMALFTAFLMLGFLMVRDLGGWTLLLAYPIGHAWKFFWIDVVANHLVVTLPRSLTGANRLKAPLTFDKGDAALKAGDPARALALYRTELDRHPGEPDIYLRMAEVHRVLKDGALAATCLSEASRLAVDPHRRGPILLQLAAQRAGNGEAPIARRVLEDLLADPALAPYHAAGRTRLAALKSPA